MCAVLAHIHEFATVFSDIGGRIAAPRAAERLQVAKTQEVHGPVRAGLGQPKTLRARCSRGNRMASGLGLAAVDSQDRIQWAVSNQASHNQHCSNPAPGRLRPNKYQAQQAKAENHTQDAVNFAFVLERHDVSPKSVLKKICYQARILKNMCAFLSDSVT
jgi:hypothetical protein